MVTSEVMQQSCMLPAAALTFERALGMHGLGQRAGPFVIRHSSFVIRHSLGSPLTPQSKS